MSKLPVAAVIASCVVALAASATHAQQFVQTGTFGAGEVGLVEFTLGVGGTYLDLTSNGSTDVILDSAGNPIGADTEIALYAGLGPTATYVASADISSGGDDDDGLGIASTLSYGTGSGLPLGDATNLGGDGLANGEDGPMLAPGNYTLVIGEFRTNFLSGGPTLGDLNSFGNEAVNFVGSVYSDATISAVPAPSSLGLIGLAGLVLIRRQA